MGLQEERKPQLDRVGATTLDILMLQSYLSLELIEAWSVDPSKKQLSL